MIDYHIENDLTFAVKHCTRFATLTEEEHKRLYVEVKNATLQGLEKKLVEMSIVDNNYPKIEVNKVQSLLLWVLGLTDDKPTGPQVVKNAGSYPDYDIDISKERRDEVIKYTKDRYGEDKVTQVVTFGTLGAKAAVRSAARALGYAVSEGDALAKHIPNQPDITIADSLAASEAMREQAKEEPYKKIIETAILLEGLPNSSGVHASAICITDEPLHTYFPLMVSKKDGASVISQFEYYDIEELYCLKFDYLGLKTLDVIQKTCDLIKENHDKVVIPSEIDVNDPCIYKLLNDGWNTGIFQFESDAFGSAVQKIKPQNIHEISDITSLMRPGPLSNGLLDQYALSKFDEKEKYKYGLKDKKLIDKIWDICSTSYGLMVYQEQCIRCFTDISGFNEIEADEARRAIGKKKADVMAKLEATFVERGCTAGYPEADLKILFGQIEKFSGYSFNLSHSVCYSYLTCQTAWLSANYPLEFYTSLLTIDAGNTDDVRRYIQALKARGFTIDAPDLNLSDVGFKIKGGGIVFGMGAIKGVGASVSNKIMKRRGKKGYRSYGEFIMKNTDVINKKVLEAYTKAGVFKSYGMNKSTLLKSTENVLDLLSLLKETSEYHTVFDIGGIKIPEFIDRCHIIPSSKPDDLSYEIETLGLYITSHPMESYIINDLRKGAVDVTKVESLADGTSVVTAGAICAVSVRKTKSKTNMASFDLTNQHGSIKCIVFPKLYPKVMEHLVEGKIVGLKGFVKDDDGVKTINVNDFLEPEVLNKVICKVTKKQTEDSKYEGIRYFRDVEDINPDIHKVFGFVVNEGLTLILSRS